jgi:hypothetical protein|tara:strand:+ start:263 stop:589 length:327 start_codon:yes stop_codon:yes gene_type:complete
MGTSIVVHEIPRCDLSDEYGSVCSEAAYADAYSPKFGQWAYLCKYHFDDHGCRLGTGLGQQLLTEEAVGDPQFDPETEDLYQTWAAFMRDNGEEASREEFEAIAGGLL